jgi:hypothetical protein
MPDTDADQIDPRRDRVWAVNVTVAFTSYVIAETADEAERIARREERLDVDPNYSARELTKPLAELDDDGKMIPHGRSYWAGREITVNEAVGLLEPVYDDQTELMPFAEGPPPLYPRAIDDYPAERGPEL